MVTITVQIGTTTTPHGVDKTSESRLGYRQPLLLQTLAQLLKGGSRRVDGAHSPPQHVPKMFYRVKVRGSGRPVHPNDTLLLKEIVDHPCAVARRIIILEDGAAAHRLKGRQHQGPDDCVSVRHAGQAAVDGVKGGSMVTTEPTP